MTSERDTALVARLREKVEKWRRWASRYQRGDGGSEFGRCEALSNAADEIEALLSSPPPSPEPRVAGVFAAYVDPCDIYLPADVTSELLQCATQNGRISYNYLLAVYRCGRAHGREGAPPPSPEMKACVTWCYHIIAVEWGKGCACPTPRPAPVLSSPPPSPAPQWACSVCGALYDYPRSACINSTVRGGKVDSCDGAVLSLEKPTGADHAE